MNQRELAVSLAVNSPNLLASLTATVVHPCWKAAKRKQPIHLDFIKNWNFTKLHTFFQCALEQVLSQGHWQWLVFRAWSITSDPSSYASLGAPSGLHGAWVIFCPFLSISHVVLRTKLFASRKVIHNVRSCSFVARVPPIHGPWVQISMTDWSNLRDCSGGTANRWTNPLIINQYWDNQRRHGL